MSSAMEFGLDDAKTIKSQGVETFKQGKSGEKTRASVISFKKFHDVLIAQKAREKGAPLSDQEKAELISKIDKKLAEQLGKSVEQLTEVDRLDIKQPRLLYSWTHFGEGVGTIRCLGTYEGNTLVKPELCCDKFGDAEQTVGTIIMTYPVDDQMQVDLDLLKARKYTNIHVYKMSAKKYKRFESAYIDARNDKRFVIDLKIQLDGDPKYQKQSIEALSGATWAREDMDPAIRAWVLDQGLRAFKYVNSNLGFEMSKDKLIERLRGSVAVEAAAEQPRLISNYDDLLT